MHKNIGPALKNATTLSHVKKELVKLFEVTRNKNGNIRIGYVSGVITSDGPKHIHNNRKRLELHTNRLRKSQSFPIFSAVDVFTNEIYNRIIETTLPFDEREVKLRLFWNEILTSGHVTDIFMTPRWEKSKGATDEHKTAKKIGLTIHYVGFDLLTA